jgi:uncharacterized protein (TIGR01777 family)
LISCFENKNMNVLITGASGLVGDALLDYFINNNLNVIVLGRKKISRGGVLSFVWDPEKSYIDSQLFEQKIDIVIHLAGAGIADQPWTRQRKKEIIDSRVKGIHLLASAWAQMMERPSLFISASAIGIYGNDTRFGSYDEDAQLPSHSNLFLQETCIQWEQAVDQIKMLGIRTSIIRIGIVLSSRGGALPQMLIPYRFGIATYFGDGKQYYSWIHISDLVRAFAFIIETKSEGVFNAVSPEPIPNKDFIVALTKAKKKKALLMSVPSLLLRWMMGERSSIVLDSARIYPKRLKEVGFIYQFPLLEHALADLLREEHK